MIENTKKLIVFIFFLLILSACSSDDSSGPALVEISSDEENVDYEEEDVDEEEDGDEEENDDMDITEFIPPELPDLPDPPLSSTKWNQVNGPFGGTITSIFKSWPPIPSRMFQNSSGAVPWSGVAGRPVGSA